MKCSELMHAPQSCMPNERLMDALAIMEAQDVGSVPVVEDRAGMRPLGVVTDRDAALLLGRTDRRASEVNCQEAMSSPAITCDSEDDIKDAVELMREHQLRRILVTDNGRLVGIIAQADLAREKSGEAKKVLEDVSQPKAAA